MNLRPFLRPANDVDIVVIRENTEGTYAGEGGFLRKGTPHEVATQGSVNTRQGVERCVRYAFDLARSRPRQHLTLVHKTNVLTFAGDLWQRTFDEVAAEYRDVTTAYNHVDAACIYFVERPQQLRRDRHRQPVRRHPHRPRRRRLRRHRPGRLRQPQPRPHRTVDVRAGARVGARHRRHRQGQPHRRHPVGGDDARVPGRGRRRRPHPQGLRRPGGASRDPPPRSATPSPNESEGAHHAHQADREDLDGRRARRLGRRQDPRPHPHAALRLRRVRGHPRLRDDAGPGRVPADRPHPAPVRQRQDLRDRHPLHGRAADRGHEGDRAGQRAAVLLHPPDRVPRVRRDGPQPAAVPGERRRSRCGRGAPTSATRASSAACG